MLNSADDPAAALVLIVNSMACENSGTCLAIVTAIADSLERPALWKGIYDGFREGRPTKTGELLITGIGRVLQELQFLKAPGLAISQWIGNEIRQHAGEAQSAEE
ncbi:hypothetical protein [Bryobacter aggregatus]|uniref:hypothetical protein n=1 Tax=Bryobacter aggregatus TaxID=360054 RepID=UPI0004E1065F|nr:hypothetical protein [Bryobacter aggregatus]